MISQAVHPPEIQSPVQATEHDKSVHTFLLLAQAWNSLAFSRGPFKVSFVAFFLMGVLGGPGDLIWTFVIFLALREGMAVITMLAVLVYKSAMLRNALFRLLIPQLWIILIIFIFTTAQFNSEFWLVRKVYHWFIIFSCYFYTLFLSCNRAKVQIFISRCKRDKENRMHKKVAKC